MSAPTCPSLGAYVLGVLDDEERGLTEAHLRDCAPCRAEAGAVRSMLDLVGALPPEALLRTTPTDDLVLQRALRQIRAEVAVRRTRARVLLAAAAGVVVAAVVGVGVLAGPAAPEGVVAQRGPDTGREPRVPATTTAVASPGPAPTTTPLPRRDRSPSTTRHPIPKTTTVTGDPPTAGTTTDTTAPGTTTTTTAASTVPTSPVVPPDWGDPVRVSGTDPVTGVRLEAVLTPRAMTATVAGVPEGRGCWLVVVAIDGTRERVARWISTAEPAALSGTTPFPLTAVAAVEVVDFDGTRYVTATR
ncbi:zf-HC2 domain-containing protein [Actinokineospora cianjurensis]|uniref:Putative zinc finger protein n=1 Tax=Actinokineospora cianjurensis TaxID=585224 RepID=A0A421AVA0_9PSEU|nr:zf-HC2 domain-containing protein [Actinokineospora cianjurensis]RLK54019.1 putative zinc finger protein [Actinokineospora cianjurensis]